MRGTRRFIDDLIGERRPTPFRAKPEDVAPIRTAIVLRAARPGGDAPRAEFIAELHQRLASARGEPEGCGSAGDGPAGDGAAAPRRAGTRRRFVQGTSVAAGAAAIGAGLEHLWEDGGPAAETVVAAGGTVVPNVGAWWTVATSQDLLEGGIRTFDLGTVTGFVERVGGQVRAVSGVCTHQGCQLALDAAVRRLNCPCHRTVFAMTGEVVRSQLRPPPRTLPELEVREAGGVVQIYAPPKSL
ncbi:Rieske (2Fe-2S) protein [Frankia sp. Cas3]|uniref:QcrA and Rieske domain-containing protein n=1 Tax=Frankia sp. Cas3 TaxID=3073926 RepID=UPI002AD47DB7|nr:Rieske (2Fe-2S) protein [Frankia sp. Cas3]